MLLEYKALIAFIHFWTIWSSVAIGFLLVRDANIRWFLAFFTVMQAIVQFAATFASVMGHPIFYHLWHIFVCLVFLRLFIFRPYICARVGDSWQRVFYPLNMVLEWFLPSRSRWVIYPAELAIQRVYKGFVGCHLLVLLNYLLAYAGVTTERGFLELQGINRLIVWDLAYAANTVLLLLEIILFAFLVFRGLKDNFTVKL